MKKNIVHIISIFTIFLLSASCGGAKDASKNEADGLVSQEAPPVEQSSYLLHKQDYEKTLKSLETDIDSNEKYRAAFGGAAVLAKLGDRSKYRAVAGTYTFTSGGRAAYLTFLDDGTFESARCAGAKSDKLVVSRLDPWTINEKNEVSLYWRRKSMTSAISDHRLLYFKWDGADKLAFVKGFYESGRLPKFKDLVRANPSDVPTQCP